MKDQLIDFKTAVLAKDKGFNSSFYGRTINQNRWYFKEGVQCYWEWDSELESEEDFEEDTKDLIPHPTQSLLQKWLREEYNLTVFIVPSPSPSGMMFTYQTYGKLNPFEESNWFETYEQALEKGLQEALKIIEV